MRSVAGKGKKAPNGSGSVWQRPDGRYSAALTYPYHDPETWRTKRKRVTTTKKDWGAAHRWILEKQGDLLGGAVLSPEDPTVREFLEGWLWDVVEPSVAPKTHEKREYHVRVHLLPAVGFEKLKNLQPCQIHALYVRLARRNPPLSHSTRRDIHTTLKQAMRWGLIPRNPVDLVDPPRPGPKEDDDEGGGKVRALTDAQAVELFGATQGRRWHHYYAVAVRSGLRPGEMLGLQWGNLVHDADPGSLTVKRNLHEKKGGGHYTKRPKSEAGRRTLAFIGRRRTPWRRNGRCSGGRGSRPAPRTSRFRTRSKTHESPQPPRPLPPPGSRGRGPPVPDSARAPPHLRLDHTPRVEGLPGHR